ncbi:T9SS type A sorting domain-containing protein [Flavisolibacter tropicus]|nr:T9SS type A sorting domain-containing protein [Flavisolibacter tropicus]
MKTRSHILWGKPIFLLFFLLLLAAQGFAQTCSGLSFSCTTTESLCVSTGSITVTVTGGVGPFNFQVIGPTSTPYTSSNVITGLRPGSYKVIVQDVGSSGCTLEQDGVVVSGTYTAQSFFLTKTNPGCSNADGVIRIGSATGGRPSFTYTIMAGSASGVGSNNTTGTFSNLIPGDYYIQSEDACHNLVTRSIAIPDFSWSINSVSINRSVCDSADAVVGLLDNKGNTNASGSIFAGYMYGVVNAVGDTTWSSTRSFRFRAGKKLSGQIVVKDPCGVVKTQTWTVPALQIPSLGATVATSNYRCDSSFTAAITTPLGLITPNYCIYNSSSVLIGCNTTGTFTNLAYGSYCIKMTDGCYDTTISRCFTSTPPKPSVAATVQESNQTCTTFTATVTGRVNISGATYCLVKDDGSNGIVECNATGVFTNVPYGPYCINIKNDPYCYDTTIKRCFIATRPLPVINAVRMTSLACNTLIVDTLQGHSSTSATQFCLYKEDGTLWACNSTGVFDNIPHGNYCIRSLSECGDLSAPYCFNTQNNTPTVGNDVIRTDRTCKTFTAYISDTSRLVNPVYEIYNDLNVLIATNNTGIFHNLRYGTYCMKIKNDPTCIDMTFTRCFTETKPPATISATLTQSNTTCTAFTANITGTGLTTPRYYLLNASNDTIARNTTGVFPNLPYGSYCGVIIDGCEDTLRVCQTFEPLRGITLSSWISCNAGNSTVAAQMTSKNNPYNFYFYHPDGRLLHSVIGTWSNWQSVDLPGLPAGAQYKIVGVDNCGRRDSAYVTPQASSLTKSLSIRQRCPSGTWASGSGDLTVTSYSATFGTVTPRLIKKDAVAISQSYTTRSGNIYMFQDLGPATYVIEYTVNQCGTKQYDTVVVNPYVAPSQQNSAIYQCDNNSFSVNSIVVNGAGPFTYEIIGSTPASPSIVTGPQASPFFNINNGVAYSLINLRATDACGNSALDDAHVLPLGNLVITRTSNCLYRTITLSVDAISGATYQWYKKTSAVDSVLIGTGRAYTIPYMLEPDIATYVSKTSVNSSCLTKLSYINMTGNCDGITLAVSLQVNGKKTTKGNQLVWNIEPGQSGAVYTIERKTDMESSFKTIANGGYEAVGSDKYSFMDESPYNGTNLYRIKKIVSNGIVEYSNTMAIVNSTTSINVFPNPVKESFTISIHTEKTTNYVVAFYTIDGRLIFQKQLNGITDTAITYPTPAGLKAGTYLLRITNQSTGGSENRKLLFQ